MAITFPVTPPATPGFSASRFSLVSAATVFKPDLGGPETVLERQGSRWRAMFTLPPMVRANAAAWTAFFASLRGMAGSFYGYDPLATTPRGTAPGSPLVAGASQTGHSLATDGWTPSQSGILLPGDFIELDGRFHMVVAQADSDGAGAATLEIEPQLRESPPDNEPIVTANPKCKMRLTRSEIGWDESTAALYRFAFAAEEAL